jgi:hypothetical protein
MSIGFAHPRKAGTTETVEGMSTQNVLFDFSPSLLQATWTSSRAPKRMIYFFIAYGCSTGIRDVGILRSSFDTEHINNTKIHAQHLNRVLDRPPFPIVDVCEPLHCGQKQQLSAMINDK